MLAEVQYHKQNAIIVGRPQRQGSHFESRERAERERRTICPLCMQITPITTTKCWLVWYHGRCWRSLWVGPPACGAALWGLALCGGPLRVQADPPTRATASLQVPVVL